MEVTRTLHDQVLQDTLLINNNNKLNHKVPVASYHTRSDSGAKELASSSEFSRLLRSIHAEYMSNRMRKVRWLLHPLSLLRMGRTQRSEKLSRKWFQKKNSPGAE